MKLPPLPSLRAFEAVARTGSVSRAAEELCVSQSSVSQHIQKLEDWLGIELIERMGRGIRLTGAGESFKAKVSEAFNAIHAGTELLRTRKGSVTVSCTSGFAASWLLPRMDDFWDKHPDVQLAIEVWQSGTPDPATVDIAVLPGDPRRFPDFVAMPILDSVTFPFASPDYLKRVGYRDLNDLPRLTLLHNGDRVTWRKWLSSASTLGHEFEPRLAQAGPLYRSGLHAISACIAGEGVALLPRDLVSRELRAKMLLQLSDLSIFQGGTYSLLTPRSRALSRGALVFADWLQSLPGALKVGLPRD
jgi:LysR family glycine cleavage system transcriptional activator